MSSLCSPQDPDWREGSILENASTKNHRKPSQVTDAFHIYYTILDTFEKPETLGKWMVFKHFDEIDEAWAMVRTAMARDELQGCKWAKCSTMRYDPTKEGPGPSTTAVICVHTEEHDMDAIGYKLVEIVKQDIKYKTNENTQKRQFTFEVCRRVTMKTIYWNRGRPSTFCTGQKCPGTSHTRKDDWNLNIVYAPGPFRSKEVHGRWILTLEYKELTNLWHHLKDMAESEKKNFGIIKMVCPPKRDQSSRDEAPVFHVQTSAKDHKAVGMKLINLVKRDIEYELKPALHDAMQGFIKKLYWNHGEPDYERD